MASVLVEIRNSFQSRESSMYKIMAINAVIFLFLTVLGVVMTLSNFGAQFSFVKSIFLLPSNLQDLMYRPWSIISYFFTHTDFFHILFNMIFFYWFGKLICEYIGSKRLTALYIYGGISGGLLFLLAFNTLPYFTHQPITTYLMGASGGVYAVVVAAATLLPNYTFYLMFLGPVKIKYIAIFYIVLSFAQTIGSNSGGNIAHLGGAALGFFFIKQLQSGNDIGKPLISLLSIFDKNIFSKSNVSFNNKKTQSSFSKSNDKVPTESEIDDILDKISSVGYEKLSKEEKKKLFFASKK